MGMPVPAIMYEAVHTGMTYLQTRKNGQIIVTLVFSNASSLKVSLYKNNDHF
jgi:hypothetical protein